MINYDGADVQTSFGQNVPEFSDAKPKPNQREASANPDHEGSVSSLTGPLFGKFGGNCRFLWLCLRSPVFSL
jgi:hypothetical protein